MIRIQRGGDADFVVVDAVFALGLAVDARCQNQRGFGRLGVIRHGLAVPEQAGDEIAGVAGIDDGHLGVGVAGEGKRVRLARRRAASGEYLGNGVDFVGQAQQGVGIGKVSRFQAVGRVARQGRQCGKVEVAVLGND